MLGMFMRVGADQSEDFHFLFHFFVLVFVFSFGLLSVDELLFEENEVLSESFILL